MITLTAKINLLSANNGDLSLNSSQNINLNNISGELRDLIGEKITYDNPFFLGSSLLGKGEKFVSENTKKQYFISSQTSNEYGEFLSPPTIVINDKNALYETFTIAFDTINNRHPNKITVDGIEYFDNDSIFTVSNLSKQSSHTIIINDWNTPNAPIVITGIYVNLEINIDHKNIISISGSLFDRSDLKLPSFGIISNKGELEFNDIDGEVSDYAQQNLLQKGLQCEISLNNTLANGASKRIGVFETDQWNYDNDNKKVSVSLKDDLEKWQEITVDEISYDAQNPVEHSLEWFFRELAIITMNNGYDINIILDEKTNAVLKNTIIKYPLLYSSSLWTAWDKVCKVGQFHIYKENGVVEVRYNGGN